MNREELEKVRELWYDAYYAGDVERLDEVQADRFTVTTERGIQSKKNQIDAIYSAKLNGAWFSRGGKKHDIELAIRGSGGSAIVYGRGYSICGQSQGPLVAFSETWEWSGDTWRVVSLSYSAARN